MSDSPGYLTPDNITGATFETKRRGLDPDAVKAHLAEAAATVAGLRAERDALVDDVSSLQAALEQAPKAATSEPAPLDDEELTERLGQDAVRVLSEARVAAADRIAEAKAEADAIRASAEEAYAQRSADADVEAQRVRANADALGVKLRNEAEESAAAVLAKAEQSAQQARSELDVEIETADADATRIIREAELTRRQILEDLARRRSAARRQIEQLRAGRERLLASHETVRRALDEISEELAISMSEARAAAETAGHSVSDTTIEELEAEIETARLTGLLDTGPLPVVQRSTPNSPAVPKPETANADEAEMVDTDLPEEFTHAASQAEDAATAESPTAESDTAESPTAESDTAESDTAESDTGGSPTEDLAGQPDTAEAPSDATSSPPAKSESTEADPQSPELASVVQLDSARNDVDTASHPAKGRDASSRTAASSVQSSPALPSKQAVEAKEKARENATVTKLESVKTGPSDSGSKNSGSKNSGSKNSADQASDADDVEVDDLFASLRSATEKPPAKKKTTAKKKTSAKKKTTAKKKSAPKPENAEPEVDSSEMARRLKRVLADEQSKAMSTVKSAEQVPDLDGLLGSTDSHIQLYWVEVLGQVDDPSDAGDATREKVSELVTSIRRRVADALENAGGDKEVAVASLRNVYRGVKTQQVGSTADAVCRTLPSPARS